MTRGANKYPTPSRVDTLITELLKNRNIDTAKKILNIISTPRSVKKFIFALFKLQNFETLNNFILRNKISDQLVLNIAKQSIQLKPQPLELLYTLTRRKQLPDNLITKVYKALIDSKEDKKGLYLLYATELAKKI